MTLSEQLGTTPPNQQATGLVAHLEVVFADWQVEEIVTERTSLVIR